MTLQTPAIDRISQFLNLPQDSKEIERLTPDASTREFFRIPWGESTSIACLYPHKIDKDLPQLDVTALFLKCGLPVAKIIETDFDKGIVIHQDFGDRILRDQLDNDKDSSSYVAGAIELIARIQRGTRIAIETGSIASQLKFDEEKLVWELNFFKTHYFGSLKKTPLANESNVVGEFTLLSRELESFATVLTHRDFHAANLMVFEDELKIIDHQDARIGPVTYDLVSLLLDRIDEPPALDFMAAGKARLQAARRKLGLDEISDIDKEFELVTIQRCLKAIGTFSNQTANFEKTSYSGYISPMFRVVGDACERLGRFENIRAMVENELRK